MFSLALWIFAKHLNVARILPAKTHLPFALSDIAKALPAKYFLPDDVK
jgi:hypothetical protein